MTIGFDAPLRITTPDALRLTGLHGLRYGEVLLVHPDEGHYRADIWNSMGLNECPQDLFDSIDADAVALEHDALLALKNGPRYWLMDAIENVPRSDRRIESFGGIDMTLVAELDLGSEIPTREPYVERTVFRDTVWEWGPGRTVHELIDPDGRTFTMQAYCIGVDPDLDEAALEQLGGRLTPPDGWTYRARVLDDTLCLQAADGVATIIQDELENTYMA